MSTSDPIFKIFQKFFFSSLCLGVAPTKKICASSSSRCRVSHTNIIVVKLLSLSHTNIIVNAVVSLSLYTNVTVNAMRWRDQWVDPSEKRGGEGLVSQCNSTEVSTRVAEDNKTEGCSANSPDRHPQTTEELRKKVQTRAGRVKEAEWKVQIGSAPSTAQDNKE